jgi:thymidylate synthase ThyX
MPTALPGARCEVSSQVAAERDTIGAPAMTPGNDNVIQMPSRAAAEADSGAVPAAAPETEVFAVHGAEPEVQAYAMAKYSRSSLSMRESLEEINAQKAEKFLNTFYFQYGHRSIADLAHIAFAIERLSILAAIILVDEQRWDGQERSTRYQDFRKSGYFAPDFGGDAYAERLYRGTAETLFTEYEALGQKMFEYLVDRTARPPEMKAEQYERTLRARAFDFARYLLPLATNTSLGQIVNARTLETQIARLLASPYAEVRRLGERLKQAAAAPVYNVNRDRWRQFIEVEIKGRDEGAGREAMELFLKEVRPAATLVKYAEPSFYTTQTREELRDAARTLMGEAAIAPAPTVDLIDDHPLEIELPATLLYEHCHYPYRQVQQRVESLSAAERNELIALGTKHRGRHDELLRAFAAGQALRFDILMDVGGFRDMHRHRRCVQILQPLTSAHGYETPEEIETAGAAERYHDTARSALAAAAKLATSGAGDYLLPLATRCRTLFKMDLAEAVYITELRTGAAGHFSYRNVAYAMYEAVARRHPSLAGFFRVTDVRQPVDLLKR